MPGGNRRYEYSIAPSARRMRRHDADRWILLEDCGQAGGRGRLLVRVRVEERGVRRGPGAPALVANCGESDLRSSWRVVTGIPATASKLPWPEALSTTKTDRSRSLVRSTVARSAAGFGRTP